MRVFMRSGFKRSIPLVAIGLPLILAGFALATPGAPAKLRYNRDMRPILAENCFPCHGPDSAARKAGLRLDKPEFSTALMNGHAAVVKGFVAASELVRRGTAQGP